MRYDKIVELDHYHSNIQRFEQLRDEILRLDWSEGNKDMKSIPLVIFPSK